MAAIKQYVSEPGGEFKGVPIAANDNAAPFQLMDYAEYKASRSYDTTQMVIFGLVRVGTLISINARPSKGKTGLAVLIADLLSNASRFLGRETMPCNVVYIPVEDGNDVANRLHAIQSKAIKIAVFDGGFSLGGNWKASVEKARKLLRHMKDAHADRVPVLIIDTLRAALEGQSVLDDRHTSPPLNALRSVAEDEGAVIVILNHTNRDNPKNTKGETLESLVAMEFLLIEDEKAGDGSLQLWVGKNRNGKAHFLMANVRFTSKTNDDGSEAAIIESITEASADAAVKADAVRMKGDKKILFGIVQTEIMDSERYHMPFGVDGPRVKIVAVEAIRPKFYERKDGNQHAKKTAFGRNLDYLLKDEYLVRGEVGANKEAVIWLANRQHEAVD